MSDATFSFCTTSVAKLIAELQRQSHHKIQNTLANEMETTIMNQKCYGSVMRKRPRERRKHYWTMTVTLLLHVMIVRGFHLPLPSLTCHHHHQEHDSRCCCLYAKSGTKKKNKGQSNTVAVNRVAYRNYEVLDTFEAGISLLGTEVKSIRDGKMNLRDGYVKPAKNGRSCTLHNVHVGKCQYVGAEYFQHEEKRPRTLLLHRSEARKLLQQTEQMGMTVVPLKAYWNDQNKLKIQIALCRGKNVRDKRATIQERDMKRETNRIIKNFRIA